MSSTLTLVLTSIILLLLLLPLMFFLRRNVALSVEDDILILKYPFTTRSIDLDKELESWKVQQAYYMRWGVFYSISMLFKNGKRIAVSSLFNQNNYDLLYNLLDSRFKNRKKPD